MPLNVVMSSDDFFCAFNNSSIQYACDKLKVLGVTVDVTFYSLIFSYESIVVAKVQLPKSSPKIMNGGLSATEQALAEKAIMDGALQALLVVNSKLPSPLLEDDDLVLPIASGQHMFISGKKWKGAKHVAPPEKEAPQGAVPVSVAPVEPPPDDSVILLSKATKLKQRVSGTDKGSVYIVCLVSPSFNMAARYKGPTVSLRVESTEPLSSEMITVLSDSGFIKKGNHWSMHSNIDSPSVRPRLLGSVISYLLSNGLTKAEFELNYNEVQGGQ